MQAHTGCLSRAPIAKILFFKLFRMILCFFLWIGEIYEQKDRLVLIGVAPLTKTTKKRRRQQGAVAYRRRHKKGHHFWQQQNSDDNETPTTTTTTKMLLYQKQQRLQDDNGENVSNW